jgi:Zn-finger nucleic acid-binding protein
MPRKLVCDECGGQWIKSFQYWKWLRAHAQNLPEKPAEEGAQLPISDSTEAKLCPECGHILSRNRVGHGVDFWIDRCASCGGFWFDKNEWDILKSRNLHDDVHFIFSTAWQHAIIEEERRAASERRFEDLIGEEDTARVRAFKEWVSTHRERSKIMAYLANMDS